MSDFIRGREALRATPVPLQVIPTPPPMPELKDIPPEVIQECSRLELDMMRMEKWSMRASILSIAAIAGSRLTCRYATGEWGEGLAHANLRGIKEWFQSESTVAIPGKKAPPDWETTALVGISAMALGTSVVFGSVHASLQDTYDKKCEAYRWAKIGAGEPVIERLLNDNEFVALEPVRLPAPLVATDVAEVDISSAGISRLRPAASASWLDGAAQFARHNPNAAAGAMVLAVVVAGAAIYLSGGTVLVFAL